MTTPLRDTQLGRLVRFVSRGKLLQYPDEVDPSLYRNRGSSPVRTRRSSREEPQPDTPSLKDSEEPTTPIAVDAGVDGGPVPPSTEPKSEPNGFVEQGRDIYLVDWYGPDDPEVWSFFSSFFSSLPSF